MSQLFQMTFPWWQFVLRALVVYAGVMVLIRASGKRAVGQVTPFDLVLLILIGNAVQNGMNGGDNSLTGALILSVSLIGLNYGVAKLAARYSSFRKLVEGVPVLIAHNGVVFRDVLKREHVSHADFKEALRQVENGQVSRIRYAVLETNGKITFVMHDPQPPAAVPSPSSDRAPGG
ncbi:MAG TPA: YetF domain-containing protein [Luteimonas sp.]|nr:YetF domain-containing protein [Luteimonas sp.]